MFSASGHSADCVDMDDYTDLQLSHASKEMTEFCDGAAFLYDVRGMCSIQYVIRFPEHHYDEGTCLGIGTIWRQHAAS